MKTHLLAAQLRDASHVDDDEQRNRLLLDAADLIERQAQALRSARVVLWIGHTNCGGGKENIFFPAIQKIDKVVR